jgi:putative ABC transport system ATP-binding protein
MPLVEIRDLVRQYHKGGETITPLGGVSLDIQAGDFVSLMGASGSGKSTLLNLLAGIDSPDEGTIHVAGVEITSLSRSRLARWRAEHIGYIFQDHNLVPVLTAWENVELPLLLVKMSRTERQRRVDIAMQAVDLADRAGHFPRQLSGGQEQRVGIARAIVAHPTLVVADEPTGDLDAETSEQILGLLGRLNRELDITMLMVTHDDHAAATAGRQLTLVGGKLIESGRETVAAVAAVAAVAGMGETSASRDPS